jgi:hypothetical protein
LRDALRFLDLIRGQVKPDDAGATFAHGEATSWSSLVHQRFTKAGLGGLKSWRAFQGGGDSHVFTWLERVDKWKVVVEYGELRWGVTNQKNNRTSRA